jgi:pimeloyl-ACP methyl ester carboxylesterase
MNMTKLHFLDPNPTGRPTVLLLHGLGANGSSWTLRLPLSATYGIFIVT